jgi:hypothetical protein
VGNETNHPEQFIQVDALSKIPQIEPRKGLDLPPNVRAKVGKITDPEWTFILKNLTVEETDIHHHAIWKANF